MVAGKNLIKIEANVQLAHRVWFNYSEWASKGQKRLANPFVPISAVISKPLQGDSYTNPDSIGILGRIC